MSLQQHFEIEITASCYYCRFSTTAENSTLPKREHELSEVGWCETISLNDGIQLTCPRCKKLPMEDREAKRAMRGCSNCGAAADWNGNVCIRCYEYRSCDVGDLAEFNMGK